MFSVIFAAAHHITLIYSLKKVKGFLFSYHSAPDLIQLPPRLPAALCLGDHLQDVTLCKFLQHSSLGDCSLVTITLQNLWESGNQQNPTGFYVNVFTNVIYLLTIFNTHNENKYLCVCVCVCRCLLSKTVRRTRKRRRRGRAVVEENCTTRRIQKKPDRKCCYTEFYLSGAQESWISLLFCSSMCTVWGKYRLKRLLLDMWNV